MMDTNDQEKNGTGIGNTLLLTESTISANILDPDTLTKAKQIFASQGFLKIENLFSKEFVQTLTNALLNHVDFNEHEMTLSNATEVSHRRHIVSIPFKSPFNHPEVYANSILLQLMREFLGPHFIFSSLGSVISLPGAMDQHIHQDYYPLFEENPTFTGMHPPYGITVCLPLVDIDFINGPTKIWAGSHSKYPTNKRLDAFERVLLCGSLGSCYFWDYRTFHAGGSNHSEQMRPLLYMAYTRRWFKDLLNPDQLLITEEEYQKIPIEHRKLFPEINLTCR